MRRRLKVTFDAPKAAASAATVADPWNFWVFRVGASGNLEGQESGNENQVRASLSANRTTEAWKLNFEAEGEYGEEEFVLDEGEIFTSISRNIEADVLVGKSLTQHWSLGVVGALESSIFSNYDVRARIAPAVEYDVFPYSQSTRRLLTLLYTIGVEAADYMEVTIYDKTSETLPDHRFETTLELRQPWGSASASFEAAQYLSQPDKYRLSTFGGVELRLFKGLAIEFFGEASRRRDQLSLRRGDATNEEILVRQRELATGYELRLQLRDQLLVRIDLQQRREPAFPERGGVLNTVQGSAGSRFRFRSSGFRVQGYRPLSVAVVVFLAGAGLARSFRCSSIFRRGTPFVIQSGAGAPFR